MPQIISLIQSCIDVLEDKTEINHVLLISGDGDFLELTEQLHNWDIRITLICQQHNYNSNLVSDVHKAYSVSYIAHNPNNWWLW
ncbi:MAG: NYN domain-containing protein [Candidatus Hodarchaeota archaeon]